MLEIKKKNKDVKDMEKKTGFKSYEQRNYDNLDSLYANQVSKLETVSTKGVL